MTAAVTVARMNMEPKPLHMHASTSLATLLDEPLIHDDILRTAAYSNTYAMMLKSDWMPVGSPWLYTPCPFFL